MADPTSRWPSPRRDRGSRSARPPASPSSATRRRRCVDPSAAPTAGHPRTSSRRRPGVGCVTSVRRRPSYSVVGVSRAGGQVSSYRHSPSTTARSGSGLVECRTKTRIGGRGSTGASPSHLPKNEIISGTRSMCGPGSDVDGAMWLHGPISSSFSHCSCSNGRKVLLR